jgi:hypothetical protein
MRLLGLTQDAASGLKHARCAAFTAPERYLLAVAVVQDANDFQINVARPQHTDDFCEAPDQSR